MGTPAPGFGGNLGSSMSSTLTELAPPTQTKPVGQEPANVQTSAALTPSCPGRPTPRPETTAQLPVITLVYRETGDPASIYYPEGLFELHITFDGELFVGAVQLVSTADCQVVDLITPADCLKREVTCGFKKYSAGEADEESGKRQKRAAQLYVVPLTLAPTQVQEGSIYTIQVTWATRGEFTFAERPMILQYATADDPRDEKIEMLVIGKPASAAEMIFPDGVVSTKSPSTTSLLSRTKPLADPTGLPPNASGNSTRIPGEDGQPQKHKSTGLSDGAKAGIAVGAVLGVLLLLALIFLCLRRRKSKRKTAGGYYGGALGSSNDLREKEAGVGIAAIPVSASPTSDGHHAHNGDAAMLGRGNSGRVVDGASLERGDVGGHAAPVGGVGAAGVARKPIGSRGVSDEEPVGREGALSSQSQVLSDEERARWEEEERRLDEDIAEAERRRLAQ